MSGIKVSNLRGETGSPTLPDGAVVTGVTSCVSFSGNLTGNVIGNVTGNISGTTGSFSGNVSIGNTLTYNDVTNIDSVGVVTARSGIKIGAGQSVGAVSGVTTYYGDGSQLTGIEFGVHNFVASGNIDNGKTVVINTDGTVKTPTQSTVINNPTITNGGSWTNDSNSNNRVSHQPGTSKYLIFYRDDNDNDYGKCVVGTLNNDKTSFSFGSIVTYESANVRNLGAVYVPNIDKHVVIYSDYGNSRYLTYAIVSISGTTPSVDATGVIDSSRTDHADICLFGTSKIVIAYLGGGAVVLRAIVGEPSASSITFGSAVAWGGSGGTEQYPGISTTSDSSKVVVAARDDFGIARVGTVSGTSISFGSKVTLNSDGGTDYPTQWNTITYDSSTQKNLFTFRDGSTGYLASRVGTVSGTSISFGTKQVHTSQAARNCDSVYQSSNQKTLVAYKNDTTGNLNISEMEISGTNVSAANTVALNESFTSSGDYHISYDSTIDRSIIGARKSTAPGFLGIVTPGFISTTTTLTTENYIGIAAEAISDGATGKINVVGGINSGQTGLTTGRIHYIQNDGTLSTSAGNPSVVAGTAISSSKIIVQKS